MDKLYDKKVHFSQFRPYHLMRSSVAILELGAVIVDGSVAEALQTQIYRGVRDAILSGRLAPGLRLPSTRELAESWNVSRSTVVLGFDQLIAEGYLKGRVGSGTYVNESIPDDLLAPANQRTVARRLRKPSLAGRPRVSRRGKKICDHYQNRRKLVDRPRPFRPGVPAEGTFPAELWRRLTSRIWRQFEREPAAAADPMGFAPLREAISVHLRASRGVDCQPRQIVIVSSTQHALTLLGHVLLDPGDSVWIEDPGYLRAQAALKSVGAKLVPIPIDREGFDLAEAKRRRAMARMVYVTPSLQYPLGITMSLARRLALLDWARSRNAWIIEDDYLAEYRFTGRPLTALQGLDEHGRVIYLGTFSKMFSPALRLGYIVVPPALLESLEAARSLIDRPPSFIDQAVLAAFIRDGHFGRHVRRMRMLYAQRHDALRAALVQEIPELDVQRATAGMHVVAWLPKGVRDQVVAHELARQGIIAPPLSNYALRSVRRGALMLGYAGWDTTQIADSVHRMAGILHEVL
jgi:GntR family transcriptional regulator/MocR family aminotransferase